MLRIFAILGALALGASTAIAQTAVAPSSSRSELGLTVYSDFAQVRETRAIAPSPARTVVWPDVARTIDPGSVIVEAAGRPVPVRRQAYAPPLSATEALRSAEGGPATLLAADGRRIEVTVESAEGPVFRAGDRWILTWPGAVEVPAGSRAADGLRWDLETAAGPALTTTYLADGLSWSADYTAVLDEAGPLALDGSVTVDNRSGASFPQATLQLVAGDVRRAGQGPAPVPLRMARAEAAGPAVERQALGNVHLYTIERPVTIPAAGSTRVSLFHAAAVPATRSYVLYGQPYWFQGPTPDLPASEHPQVRLEFVNRGIAGPEEPLPAGTLRTYRRDRTGRLQFTGGADIPHTPAGEKVAVVTGTAFDLVAERVRTDYRQLDTRTAETAWRIEIRNHGARDAVVQVVETMPAPEWTIVEESRSHERLEAQTVRWAVPVAAGGSSTLTYRVRAGS